MSSTTLKFAANLSWLYTDVPFLERFAQAAQAGFTAVEFLFPYAAGIKAIKSRLDEVGLTVALFNLPPGDVEAGEFGLLATPARQAQFRQDFDRALVAATRLGCRRLHVMVGNKVAGLDPAAQIECALENLAWAAPQAAEAGVTLLIEALNATDVPKYLIHTSAEAMQIVTAANQPQVKLQYDVYHARMMAGNPIETITANVEQIGHIQIADVPGRHQPGSGEIDYPAIFDTLERLDYEGYIGLEYRPTGDTEASLAWLPRSQRGITVLD